MSRTEYVELAVDRVEAPELLLPPSERHLGGKPDLKREAFRVRVGRRPFARSLRALYEANGRRIPADLELYRGHDVWLVQYTVGVLKEGRWNSLKQLGIEVELPKSPRVVIRDMLPTTEFIPLVKGSLKCSAAVRLAGDVETPAAVTELLDKVAFVSADVGVHLSSSAEFVGQVSFSVLTPKVVATGVGDHVAEWVFTKADDPIVGDVRMLLILITPRSLDLLTTRARVYAVWPTWSLVPIRQRSQWIPLQVPLDPSVGHQEVPAS